MQGVASENPKLSERPCSPNQPACLNAAVILLVEDELMVREVTGEVLSHAGYRVLENEQRARGVASGYTAQGPHRSVLTDIVMPEMNGADLAHRMVNHRPDLVTLFMSGYAEHDVLRNGNSSKRSTYKSRSRWMPF